MANSVPLEHVGIRAQGDDFEPTIRFYEQAFGWRRFSESEAPFHIAFIGNEQGDIIEFLDTDGPPLPGPAHLSFTVPMAEFDDLQQRVAALGVTFDPPLHMPSGDVILYFNDPAGNRAQIIGRVAPFGPGRA